MNKKTLQRMKTELRQLSDRIDKINVFTVTDTFDQLSRHEQLILRDQLHAMTWYYESLKNRIEYYGGFT